MQRTAIAMIGCALVAAPVRAQCGDLPAVLQFAPMISSGAGAVFGGNRTSATFELAFDVAGTFVAVSDTLRIGPWTQLRTSNFASFEPTGGLRFQIGLAPVRWFYADGFTIVAIDAGVAYAWRDGTRTGLPDSPVLAARLSWGFTAPLALGGFSGTCRCTNGERNERQYGGYRTPHPSACCRPPAGVADGFRVYASLRRSLGELEIWEIGFGLDIELVGLTWFAAS